MNTLNMGQLKIGLVGPLPPPSGGMANQCRQLAGLLRDEGVHVEVVQVNAPYKPHWIAHLKGVRAVFRLLPYLWTLWRVAGRVQLFHVMANSGWSWHLFAAPAILIGKLRGIAVVVNYRGGEADSFLARSYKRVKQPLSRADALVVPSGFLEAVFARYGFTSRIVPNIIDLGRFSPREAAISSAPNILVARNLEPIYDNATALRAFRIVRESVPAARLTIAGSGPEKMMLQQLAAELGIADAVTFSGRVENADMPKLYRSADVMINPSLADNMPISVLESLASGVPVVSTNVGGVAYLVKDGETALLVPPGDHTAMAAALLRLLREAELARHLSVAGLAEVRQYAWPNVRERLLSVYQVVLAGAQR